MVSINELVDLVESIAGINVKRSHNLSPPKGFAVAAVTTPSCRKLSIGSRAHVARWHWKKLTLDLRPNA